MIKKYDISTLDPAPAMTHTKFVFTGSFAEAIKAAHKAHKETHRITCISDQGGSTFWYRISAEGVILNMNLPQQTCEHCGKPITTKDHITIERHSGPSTHHLHFHKECWRCPKCGTNGPHYCPSDVATE